MGNTQRMLHPRANAHRLQGHLRASVGYAQGLRDNYETYHPECDDELEELQHIIAQLQSMLRQSTWLKERSAEHFRQIVSPTQ